jgi:hypothetical protein
MTQRERVLTALEAHGVLGVKTTDFLLPDVIDGGVPIIRLAARVKDLRDEGYRIRSYTEPNGVCRYVLVPQEIHVGSVLEDKADDMFTEPVDLFDASLFKPRPSGWPDDTWVD